jgi:hypothetical protein
MPPRLTAFARRLSVLLALAFVIVPAPAVAKRPGLAEPIQIQGRAPEATVMRGKHQIGVESGVPRALYGVNYLVSPGEPEAMARQYLRENAVLLRLDRADLSDLALRGTRKGVASTTIRFEQRLAGLPVLAPDIAVTIDDARRVTFVMNGYQPGLTLASAVPAVAAGKARSEALARLGVQGTLALDDTRLAVMPEGKLPRLVWQVRMVPAVSPPGDWEVLVDATSGEIVRLVNRALHVNGSGFVFVPDPLGAAHATYGQAGYTDGGDASTAQLDAARSNVTLLDITDLGGGTFKLEGPYATIVDTESPFDGLFTQPGTTFAFNRTANAFEAVNCYYHVDHTMRHVNLTLGVPVMPYQYLGGVRFDPTGLNGADNSHYLSGTGVISFGEGGVDDAEDADVVIHELGHGLHDWLTLGGISQVNGLSEGLGDYVAQSYSRSLNQWLSNEPPYHWVFSWDGHNEFWSGRITDYGATYPGGLVGQVHADGQIWSTCLMRIWNQIGRNQTDRAVYEGIAMTNGSSSQNDAAQAVLQAAITMGYSSPELGVIVSEFQATGYDVSIGVDYVTDALFDECASDPTNENGLLEPGEDAEIRVTLEAASLPQTGVTGVLSTTTPGVTILDDTATWPDLTAGVPAVSDAPHFRVRLAETVACLSAVDFDVTVTSNEGGPYPASFSRPVGATVTPGGLPVAIPDDSPAGVASTLSVPSGATITDLDVRVEITHTWVGDLFIKLRSPMGTEVTLLDRPGFTGSGFGCSNDNMNVTFDDAAATVLETHCAGTTPWYAGPARAVGLLSAFNGQTSQGDWVLTVSDNAGQDVGAVVDWELLTTPPLVGACDPCQATTAVPIAIGGARLELGQNRPNPFSPSTTVDFHLAEPGRAAIHVYDLRGHRVATLVDGDFGAGRHVATWNGVDHAGHTVAPGFYFYKLTSGAHSVTRSMIRMR